MLARIYPAVHGFISKKIPIQFLRNTTNLNWHICFLVSLTSLSIFSNSYLERGPGRTGRFIVPYIATRLRKEFLVDSISKILNHCVAIYDLVATDNQAKLNSNFEFGDSTVRYCNLSFTCLKVFGIFRG